MATYVYKCKKCEKQFEVVQKMVDDPFKIHNEEADPDFNNCLGELSKIFSPVGIVWKGSGFYKTDTRGTSSTKASTSKTDSNKSESASSESSKKEDTSKAPSSTNTAKSSESSNKSK